MGYFATFYGSQAQKFNFGDLDSFFFINAMKKYKK